MIIGLCGFIGSGKSTVANIFEKKHGFAPLSFADSVKDCLSVVFGWDRDLLEGITPESRAWRETTDTWWSKKLGIENFTPRFAMTHIATDLFRDKFNQNIWIYSLEKKIQSYSGNLIISDCRFINEIGMLKNSGGKLIHVTRGEEPSWKNIALIANSVVTDMEITQEIAIQRLSDLNVSPSEYQWVGSEYDNEIKNVLDFGFLSDQVEKIIMEG